MWDRRQKERDSERTEILQMVHIKSRVHIFLLRRCIFWWSQFFFSLFSPIKCLGKKLLLITTVEKKELQNLHYFFFFADIPFLYLLASIEKFPRSQANIYFTYYKYIRMRLLFGWEVTIITGQKNANDSSERSREEKGKLKRSVPRIAINTHWTQRSM